MTKEMLDKIREALAKKGLSEEEISEVIAEIESEETPADETPKEEPTEPSDTPTEETPAQEADKAPQEEEPVPATSEGDVPPAEETPVETPTEEAPVEPAAAPVDPDDVTQEIMSEETPAIVPVEPAAPAAEVPAQDPVVMIGDLQGKLEESAKTISGLTNRISLLEEALKKAGIMDIESETGHEVGVDDTTRGPSYNDEEESFDDLIDEMNRYRR